MDFVIMAAGAGRRLRPLTEVWPKPILPIDGRPVIASLVRELAAAGAETPYVVTGHLAEQVESLLGGGDAYGLKLQYVRQPRPDGSADTVGRALAAGARAPLVVTAADTLFARGDIGRFAAAFERSGAVGAVAVRPNGTPAPVWGVGPGLIPFLDRLPGPPFELLEALRRATDSGHEVGAIAIGATRDLTRPLDLVRENFPYLI